MKLGKTPQRILTLATLLVALSFLAIGGRRTYVLSRQEKPPALASESVEPFGQGPSFQSSEEFQKAFEPLVVEMEISDFLLLESATFTGVERHRDDGSLWLMFDPAEARGKKACPT
jgi:hypothetical protein